MEGRGEAWALVEKGAPSASEGAAASVPLDGFRESQHTHIETSQHAEPALRDVKSRASATRVADVTIVSDCQVERRSDGAGVTDRRFRCVRGRLCALKRLAAWPERRSSWPDQAFSWPEQSFSWPERSLARPEQRFSWPERSFAWLKRRYSWPERGVAWPEHGPAGTQGRNAET